MDIKPLLVQLAMKQLHVTEQKTKSKIKTLMNKHIKKEL